jgi:UDP-GlcNAc:undecaprenyl-phosphate GlcNAc-1-phosphate transferase
MRITLAVLCLFSVLLLRNAYQFTSGHPWLYAIYLMTVAFLLSYTSTPIFIHFGRRFGLIDHPDGGRKQHAQPTPLTGGVGIVVAFIITIVFNFHFSTEMKAILTAGLLIFIIGLLDDRWGLPAWLRLVVQVTSALIVIKFGISVSFIPDSLGGDITGTIITLIWILGITNAMNFIDGLDGIAGGTSVVQALFFAIVAYATKQPYMMFLSIALAGSCLGFLRHNYRGREPARVFLGSNGSTFLGFMLASIALLGRWGDSIIDLIVPVLIMSVLIFDQSLTTILRIYRKNVRTIAEWINFTGRDHFHHQLYAIFKNKTLAFVMYNSVNVCFGLAALAIQFSDVFVALIVLVHTILAFIIIGTILVFGNRTEKPITTVRDS